MKEQGLINKEVFMFNLLDSNFSPDNKTYANGVIFGEDDIDAFLGKQKDNIRYIDVIKTNAGDRKDYMYWTVNNEDMILYYNKSF